MKELSLKQNFLWNTIGSLVYQGCQWLTTILVVVLSPSYENSGIMAFAMATANIYTSLATYNIRTFQVSDVKDEFTSQNYVGFRLVTVGAAWAACALYSVFVSQSSVVLVAMLAYLLFKADESFANVLYGIDQKAKRMDFIGVSQGVRGILTLVMFSLLMVLTENLAVAFFGMAASCFLVTVFYDLPHAKRLSSVAPRLTVRTCGELLRACAPAVTALFFFGAVATVARQWFGITNGEEALGVYAAVATPCVLVQVMANYLYSPFLVPLAESWNSSDISSLKTQLAKLLLVMILVIAGLVLLAYLFGPTFLRMLYGQSIEGYAWMITPAVIAASLMAVAYFITDLLIVVRCFVGAVVVNAVALMVCLLVMNLAIKVWYMNGVNIALIVAFAAGIVCGLAYVAKTLRVGGRRTQ